MAHLLVFLFTTAFGLKCPCLKYPYGWLPHFLYNFHSSIIFSVRPAHPQKWKHIYPYFFCIQQGFTSKIFVTAVNWITCFNLTQKVCLRSTKLILEGFAIGEVRNPDVTKIGHSPKPTQLFVGPWWGELTYCYFPFNEVGRPTSLPLRHNKLQVFCSFLRYWGLFF